MAVTYLGSRIFYRGSEPTGSTLSGFSGTYTPYSSGNTATGMIKINGTNYYVAGCNSSGKTYTYIT
jgi:glucan-binding YG repeat protein